MNIFGKTSTAFLILALSLGLVSCNDNRLVVPDKRSIESARVGVNDITPTMPKYYKLSKYGDDNLTYYPDGRLKRVMDGPDVRGSLASRTEYSYSPGIIKALTYSGTSLIVDQTYLVDVKTNRCYEFNELWYIYSNSDQTRQRNLVFTYTDKGQLKTCSEKQSPQERTEYTYNADGDVIKAISYGAPQFAYSPIALDETTFAYDQPAGDPILTDLHAMNSDWITLPNYYLPIFGKLSKHLVKLTINKPLVIKPYLDVIQHYYTYTLNADGYVTDRNTYSVSGGALLKTDSYKYLVTPVTVQQ